MTLKVVGAGVGRTGTHSLKIALEQLLGGPCHHMIEVFGDPTQAPSWMTPSKADLSTGQRCLLATLLFRLARVFLLAELSAANPDALVLLSVRDPESWYRSASNTIFQ